MEFIGPYIDQPFNSEKTRHTLFMEWEFPLITYHEILISIAIHLFYYTHIF